MNTICLTTLFEGHNRFLFQVEFEWQTSRSKIIKHAMYFSQSPYIQQNKHPIIAQNDSLYRPIKFHRLMSISNVQR